MRWVDCVVLQVQKRAAAVEARDFEAVAVGAAIFQFGSDRKTYFVTAAAGR
jgi:hypothetical protein